MICLLSVVKDILHFEYNLLYD
ncbi:unnamed protein product [Callosobruchus maculatus]|uniref:Uncharacterized protein n=1 Tax=Callosobruchus maculatus TaxID=64391 RepID=A0A653C0L4_CALMS|nr:unnamed protein product [Callosobruchus maculatus]